MRLNRFHRYLLGSLLGLLIGPVVFSQNFGGRRGGGMDPNAFWDQISGGKESFNINDPLPGQMERMGQFMRPRWDEFLKRKGVNNGVMTKDLYLEMSAELRQNMGGGKRAPAAPGGAPGANPAANPDSPPGDPKEEDIKIEEEARRFFPMLDRNKDGVLDRDEARRVPALRDFDRYDLNFDGKISIDEFIEAYRDEQGKRGAAAGPAKPLLPGRPAAPLEEDKRPVVYRVGKLPKELPAWFALMDEDKDGQVGLYEWKKSGKPVTGPDSFLAMDANGDGFLTVEEVLRYLRATGQLPNTAVGGPSTGGQPGIGIAGGRGGMGGMMGGRGGRGGRGGAAGAGAPAWPQGNQGNQGMRQGRGAGGRGAGGRGAGGRGGRGRAPVPVRLMASTRGNERPGWNSQAAGTEYSCSRRLAFPPRERT